MIGLIKLKKIWEQIAALVGIGREQKRIEQTNKLVIAARKHSAEGEEQLRYGTLVKNLIETQATRNLRVEFARIAVWHFEKSAKYFQQSAVEFQTAARAEKDFEMQEEMLKTAKKMSKRISIAEYMAREPKSFLDEKLGSKEFRNSLAAI